MPTNFHISPQPALRCVTGESYPLRPTEPAAGFFTRLRMAERLVIHSGPQHALDLPARAWQGRCAELAVHSGFRKNTPHA